MSPEKQRLLAEALRLPPESTDECLKSMQAVLEATAPAGDFLQRLDSEYASLKTRTLHYPPFANGRNAFVDRLFERFFELSVIRRDQLGQDMGFHLKSRINQLDDDEYQIATNLLGTLPRLKKLRYYWTPIRISIGAVCLRRHRRSLSLIGAALSSAHSRMPTQPLWPIVVEGEVGAVHVQQTLHMDLRRDVNHFVDDIDPVRMAIQLRTQDKREDVIACTVTDEITALAIARELGKDAMLIFPLTTAQSVQTSHLRRALPAHGMGTAISRKNRWLRDYLDDAWSAFLRWEHENIAQNYAQLYHELTEFVSRCLNVGPIIGSGDVGLGPADLSGMADEERELFVYRTARAFSRRALTLDRRAINDYSRDGSPWRNVLSRAREIALIRDAQDRSFVRRRILALFNEVSGQRDGKSPQVTPPRKSHDAFRDLLPLLEQEFDTAVDREDMMRAHGDSAIVEHLTSELQDAMERSSVVALHTTIIQVALGAAQESNLTQLHGELVAELKSFGDEQQDPLSAEAYHRADETLQNLADPLICSLLAVYRGNFVGCVDLYKLADENTCQLRNLYVKRAMRRQGVGRLLLRGALREISLKSLGSVMIDLGRIPPEVDITKLLDWFERNGFRRGPRETLSYSML